MKAFLINKFCRVSRCASASYTLLDYKLQNTYIYFLFLDRYVMLGNHMDAWVFGAVDASSGTTVMMEIARALGEKYKTGR